MTIKRALLALTALTLIPAVSFAQVTPPPTPDITPAPGTANIVVAAIQLDGNTEDSVLVSITCDNGTIAPTNAVLGNGEGQVFVIDNLGTSTAECTVTQSALSDYDSLYLCDPTADAAGDAQCGNPDALSETSCSYAAVAADQAGYCAIYNLPSFVDVDVTKVWEEFGAEQADFDTDVRLTLFCEATGLFGGEIDGGTRFGSGPWFRTVILSDYTDEDGDYIGEGTVTFGVRPTWYPTESDPDDQEYQECYVQEDINNSAIEVDNGCTGIEVSAGMGDECTITNTVFFEGIPTLSQYGMANMALLMLGVGFVGMRRFV